MNAPEVQHAVLLKFLGSVPLGEREINSIMTRAVEATGRRNTMNLKRILGSELLLRKYKEWGQNQGISA